MSFILLFNVSANDMDTAAGSAQIDNIRNRNRNIASSQQLSSGKNRALTLITCH